MRRFTLTSLVLALVLLSSSTTSAATETCKNTYGGDFIRAKVVKCGKARAVVREWGAGFKADGNPNREALGFACVGIEDPIEGLIVKCTRARKRITFYANAP